VAIQVLATVYKKAAHLLTEWKNHPTDTKFEDALIIKSFVFSFCNCYGTLFYIAFIKRGEVILGQYQLCDPDVDVNGTIVAQDVCFGNLGYSLLIIFILQIFKGNSLEIILPTLRTYYVRRENLKVVDVDGDAPAKPTFWSRMVRGVRGGAAPVRVVSQAADAEDRKLKLLSPAEDQYFLKSYGGTFDDMLELTMQFGYVTLFVAAFPLAPFLGMCANQVSVRVDSFKLCRLHRRPAMMTAQDIGTWQHIFYLMGFASVLTNGAVIFFTSEFFTAPPSLGMPDSTFQVWMWILSSSGIIFIKWLVDAAIPDVPDEVSIQLQRQDYLVRKCLLVELDSFEDAEGNEENTDEADAAANAKDDAESRKIRTHIALRDPSQEHLVKQLALRMMQDAGFDMARAFKDADEDASGKISLREFADMARRVGGVGASMTPSEIHAVAVSLDHDGDGLLDYNEFMAFARLASRRA